MISLPLLVLLCIGSMSVYVSPQQQPKSIIKIYTVEKCGTDTVPWTFEVKNVDEVGHISIDAEFDFSGRAFKKDFEYRITAEKFENGVWQTVADEEGILCDAIEKYIPKAWKKLQNSLDPIPDSACATKPGVYKLKDFEVMNDDTDIPPVYGDLVRLYINIYDKDEHVFCTMLEGEVVD